MWKIIILHEPGWSAGRDSASYPHPNNEDVQNFLQPICEQYGVQLVFAGHNHYYSRACKNGILHITTAGGGAPIYTPDAEYPNVICTFQENHFCKVEINDNILTVSAINSQNNVFDEFSINSDVRPNYLLGYINLYEGNGIVSDVSIEINGSTYSPDEIGYYGIELESGFYEVTVSLENYVTQTFNNIEILDGTETTLNVTLEAISSIENEIVSDLFHLQNYPNPFNPFTTISFSLTAEDAENAEIEIFNIKGQKVNTLVNEILPAGEHSVIWNGRDSSGKRVSSGIYFYKLKAGNYQKVRKMVLLK